MKTFGKILLGILLVLVIVAFAFCCVWLIMSAIHNITPVAQIKDWFFVIKPVFRK